MKKYIIGFVAGLIVATTIAVSATILYQANEIGFTPADNNWNVNNLESALNDLYANKGSGSAVAGTSWDFEYSDAGEVFRVPASGNYKLEVWGAQGGSYNNELVGGYGAYSVGTININKTQNPKIYIYVGGAGVKVTQNSVWTPGGFNGGGDAYSVTTSCGNTGCSGGGATHIAFKSGTLAKLGYTDAVENHKLIIAAGGGGGAGYRKCSDSDGAEFSGGSGGGTIGHNGVMVYRVGPGAITLATGGTQTTAGTGGTGNGEAGSQPGSFGQGGTSNRTGGYSSSSGGGGGLYGGGSAMFCGGAGGSGYLSSGLTNAKMVMYASENEYTSANTEITQSKSSNATSDYTKMGDGFARITYLGNSN